MYFMPLSMLPLAPVNTSFFAVLHIVLLVPGVDLLTAPQFTHRRYGGLHENQMKTVMRDPKDSRPI